MTNRLPQKRFLWALAAVGTVCGAALLFNEPTDIRASDGETAVSDLAMFAVESQGGELIRYDVASGQLQSIGAVTSPAGDIFYGIQAMAHIPGHANLMGMWTDPADGQAKLLYIHSVTARGMVVGQPMGPGTVTGATTVRSAQTGNYEIYALHTSGGSVPFEIVDNAVVPSENFVAKVDVLGAAISMSGQYDLPVTMRLHVGDEMTEPFGAMDSPTAGNLNDLGGRKDTRSFIIPGRLSADTRIAIDATSWVKGSGDQNLDSGWRESLLANTLAGTQQVKVLRHGDPVPNMSGFLDQSDVTEFVNNFIDTDTQTVTLAPNQAIYLFELGTTSLTSAAADFQDLVVLVSLARHEREFDGDGSDNPPAPGQATSRLVKVNHQTGATEHVVNLTRSYKSLAASSDTRFFAVSQNKLYAIDTVAGTETLLGTTQYDHLAGLEMFGRHLLGYASNSGRFVEVGQADAATIGSALPVGVNQVEAMTILQISNLPMVAYD